MELQRSIIFSNNGDFPGSFALSNDLIKIRNIEKSLVRYSRAENELLKIQT